MLSWPKNGKSHCSQPVSPRPPYLGGYQAVASVRRYKQALPCWPSAPSFLLQVSGHDSLTVQSLLTQTGELPNTRWLDRCANPLARPLLQAWAWSPTFSVGNKGSVCSSALPTQGRGGWRAVPTGHPPRPSAIPRIPCLILLLEPVVDTTMLLLLFLSFSLKCLRARGEISAISIDSLTHCSFA